jgi:hypothetical protein
LEETRSDPDGPGGPVSGASLAGPTPSRLSAGENCGRLGKPWAEKPTVGLQVNAGRG